MKIFNVLLATFLVALLVLVIGAACYYVFMYAVNIYRGLDTKVINIIFAALATGLLAMALTSMIGKRLEMRDKNRLNFPRKAEVYQKFVKSWANLIRSNDMGEHDLSELNIELENTEKELVLLASAGVINKYIELQSCQKEPDEYISVFGQLIMEIRQDLGNSNIGLNGEKLTSLFFEISLVADQQDQSSSDDNREVSFGAS